MMYLEEPGLIVRAQARIAGEELEILPRLHRLGASTVTPTFQQFSYANTELLAERLALRSGVLALCRKRGFRGLIDLPVPKMAAGANLSMIYAEAFETPQETGARWSQDCQRLR